MMPKNIVLAAALVVAWVTNALALELTSPDVAQGATIAKKHVFGGHGCDGGNLSPALHWTAPPPGTKSFAVTVHDPDARGGAGFWHWLAYDLPAATTGLPEGVAADGKGLPAGAAQAASDFGRAGYGGPCPPKGDKPHHYHFTVYALKTGHLKLPPDASAAQTAAAIQAEAIGSAELVATYGR